MEASEQQRIDRLKQEAFEEAQHEKWLRRDKAAELKLERPYLNRKDRRRLASEGKK